MYQHEYKIGIQVSYTIETNSTNWYGWHEKHSEFGHIKNYQRKKWIKKYSMQMLNREKS